MIRKYVSDDIDAIIHIWATAAIETYNAISEPLIQSISRDLQEKFLPASETWVAEHEEKIVGFIALLDKIVGGLVVHPEYQGIGVGKSLVEHVKAEKGSISLDILKENTKTFKFYKKCGFMSTKESICPITGAETVTVVAS
jgi:putative acetyltransferase